MFRFFISELRERTLSGHWGPSFSFSSFATLEKCSTACLVRTEATEVVITAQHPRGDPLAPWCLNLVMSCWIRTLQPLHTLRVFLDDRCILHPVINELSDALHATFHFDWSFGFATNVEKSSRFYVGSLPAARHAGSWFQLPLKVQLKYLGAVLETQTYLPMHSGSNRALQVHRQLERVRFLPSSLLRKKMLSCRVCTSMPVSFHFVS